jgi:hypothetical protein
VINPPRPRRRPLPARTALALALACAAQALPSRAAAEPPNSPGYAFGAPGPEALLLLTAALSNLSSAIPQRATGWAPDAPHPYDRTAATLSDVTGAYAGAAIGVLAGFGLEAGYFGESGVRGGWVYAQRTSLVEIEGLLFSVATVNALKRLTGRCRPQHFVDGKCASNAAPDAHQAFPSGHTAPMGVLAGTRLTFAAQSTGPSGYRWGSFALVETMALATAVLRVRAGKHSWSDVTAGLVIGHAVGVLVALAHPMMPVPEGDLGRADGALGQGGFSLSWGASF